MTVGELPKYLVIADSLRAEITSGALPPGTRLPSQHAMAADHGVTVMTLRQALAQLEDEGLVHATRGRGTFVSEPPTVRFGLDHLWSFTQQMASHGVAVSTEVLHVRRDGDTFAQARSVLGEHDVVEVTRRRSIDGVVAVLQRSFVTAPTWAQLTEADLVEHSLYALLERDAGCILERAAEVFRAVTVLEPDAELLGTLPGSAVLESCRTSFDDQRRAFLFDQALMLGSATEIRAERTADSLRLGYSAREP